MANFWAIHSVGDSLINFLRNTYPDPLRSDHPCEFRLISSSDLAEDQDMGTAVTLYLYRVEIDEHQRQHPQPDKPLYPLSLSLYYLMIIWADSALAGMAGIPSLLYGPTGHGAHAVDEWVSLKSLLNIYETLKRVILDF